MNAWRDIEVENRRARSHMMTSANNIHDFKTKIASNR
jgi:hypothetical protein